jgi:uncharacterized protein YbjT (DUF2867 family)
MENILLAGATGYLGRYILRELKAWEIPTIALARHPVILGHADPKTIRVIKAEVTRPESIAGVCKGVDTVISTIGVTRLQDGFSYLDVDYQANLNLLREAQQSGVRKFVYVSVIDGDKFSHLAITSAKEKFVDELKNSGLEYTVIRPNGFYSDMLEFLKLAQKGRIYLFGDGELKLNPIHGADLAEICVRAISEKSREIIVGGPDILTQNEIAGMAFSALGKPPAIVYLPDVIRRTLLSIIQLFRLSETIGQIEFFLTMIGRDTIAPRYGTRRLQNFYEREVQKQNTNKKSR